MTFTGYSPCAKLPKRGQHAQIGQEVESLSTDSLSLDQGFDGFDGTLRKPPMYLFYLGLTSVTIGILIGGYGIFIAGHASNSQELIIGIAGYLMTALFPILILQLIRSKHAHALAANQEQPYDIYAGGQMESKYRKVVLVGLIGAALPIWVFFLPIAEKFTS